MRKICLRPWGRYLSLQFLDLREPKRDHIGDIHIPEKEREWTVVGRGGLGHVATEGPNSTITALVSFLCHLEPQQAKSLLSTRVG